MANTLRNSSSRYGQNVFLYGALFGSTVFMAMLMHIVHVYYGGVSDCVVDAAAASRGGDGTFHLTGGYGNDMNNSTKGISTAFNPFRTCGASGPVKLVSFLSSMLVWSNAILAVTLYARRGELLSEGGGVGSSNQYDEIGGTQSPAGGGFAPVGEGFAPVGGGFAGDFPAEQGIQTMVV